MLDRRMNVLNQLDSARLGDYPYMAAPQNGFGSFLSNMGGMLGSYGLNRMLG
jgi:hypothetical protein